MSSSVQNDSITSLDTERTEIREGDVFALPTSLGPEVSAQLLPNETVHELVGQNLDHYRIESLVGIGGMGAVFRGRDLRLDRVVAIKVVPMSQRRAESLRRFRMEAQSAAKLDHPNIAQVFYVGETERWSYIVFEFIEGMNLRQLVLERGPLSVDDATRFTCQVAEALQHACERGVVHRDIKPSNILIGLDGRAKIVDMGLARTTELDRSTGDLTASGVTLGTFDYISPEQAHDPRDADVRSDIYSLGCTLYFLLTAQPPFPDGTALQKLLMHGTKLPEDPRCFRNDVSDALIAILRKMMAKRPRDRYQEPIDLVNDLRTLAAMDSLDWKHEFADDSAHAPSAGRSWWEFFLPAVICACGIGLVTLWLYNENQRSGVYVIPRVEVNDVASSEANTPTVAEAIASGQNTSRDSAVNTGDADEESVSDATSREPSVATAIVLADPNTQPSGIPKPFETVRSLEEAILRWESNEAMERIILATSNIKLQKPIAIARSSKGRTLRLEGTDSLRPTIVLSDNSNRIATEPLSSWFGLDGASVELRGVDIDIVNTSLDSSAPALFQITAGARLRLIDSTITLRSNTNGRLPAIFCFRNPTASSAASSSIELQQSAIRGQADLIRIESNDRIEIEMEEVWAAMSGSIIDIEGSKTLNRSPRIRATLNHVTSISLNPWVRIRMGTANPYPVPFVRVANESIFAGSQTLVEWDASNVADWPFSEQANRVEDLGRWIDLRGMDNVYDVPTIMRLLQVIMSMSSEEVSIDSDSNLLRNERGTELLSAWQANTAWEASRMHTVLPKTTTHSHAGLNPGCNPSQLPSFPARLVP
ncbi:MAG: serine/threonine protein kinase [Planctomycetes bacterium]|nr:serine/threonine protein kinase [Planctomycetota bacterium]